MDPRRARDPRLARAQQQRQASDSPAPSAIPPHVKSQPPPQPLENDTPPYSTPTPPQPFLQANSELDMIPGLDLPPQTYKPRPLFCVVCASNQVRVVLNTPLSGCLGLMIDTRIGQWRVITFYREFLFPTPVPQLLMSS